MGSYFNRTPSIIAGTDTEGVSVLFTPKKWTYVSQATESSSSIRSMVASGALSRRTDPRDSRGDVSDHVVAEVAQPEVTPVASFEAMEDLPAHEDAGNLESEALKETSDPATGEDIPAPMPKKRRG